MKFKYLTDVTNIEELIEWHNQNSSYVVLDTETTGLNVHADRIVHIQMSGVEPHSAVMFDAEHAHLLLKLKVRQVGWNWVGFDWKMLKKAGVDLLDYPAHDAMLIDHLVDENREHTLDSRVQELFNDDYKQRFWAKYKSYVEAPLSEQLEYACKDIVYTDRVYRHLLYLYSVSGLPNDLINHVHRLANTLLRTECDGLRVDVDYCLQVGSELKAGLEKAHQEARHAAQHEIEVLEHELWAEEITKAYKPKGKKWKTLEKPVFNFGSSGQVCNLLYSKLGLRKQLNSKTKKVTADDKALERLGDAHEVLPRIREIRKLSKMSTAFVDSILEKTTTGRIYPRFNVNGTVTGRISHSEPNMAQMPSKGEWAKIRGIFVPNLGERFLTCDYGMLEVVVAAHYSRDKNLLSIIYDGASKHDITATSLGVDRATAKTLNFALQYQCSPRKVAEIMGCSASDGDYYWNLYWETYEGEKVVVDECKAKVDRGEPIVNLMGRHRRFPSKFNSQWEKEAAYRQAYSSLIQGTGSDLCSWATYTVDSILRHSRYGSVLFTVHDELVATSKLNFTDETSEILKNTMIQAGPHWGLNDPLTVECSEPLERWAK